MTTTKAINEKYCTECGNVINIKAEICPKCGVRQMPAPSAMSVSYVTPQGKSKLAAGLLALFLGGIGLHKFYLGRPLQGVFYLLFCWTFIPALIGFIEGIVYLCESDEAFARQTR